MMKMLNKQKISLLFQYGIIGVLGWALTLYIFLSSYAILSNTPLPYIGSVGAMHSNVVLNDLIRNKAYYNYSPGSEVLSKNALFEDMRIPRLNVQLNLLPAIRKSNTWVYRSNSGHYFFLGTNVNTNPNYIVIYVNSNWRSILDPEKMIIGDNLFLEKNDNTTSLFRITDKKILGYQSKYVPAEADQINLILIIEDTHNHVEYVFQAVNIVNTSNSAV